MTPELRATVGCVVAFLAGIAAATVHSARAEQQAIDRALVERLVRAEEQQARQLEAVARAAERCRR
jgi:hypothetical protein